MQPVNPETPPPPKPAQLGFCCEAGRLVALVACAAIAAVAAAFAVLIAVGASPIVVPIAIPIVVALSAAVYPVYRLGICCLNKGAKKAQPEGPRGEEKKHPAAACGKRYDIVPLKTWTMENNGNWVWQKIEGVSCTSSKGTNSKEQPVWKVPILRDDDCQTGVPIGLISILYREGESMDSISRRVRDSTLRWLKELNFGISTVDLNWQSDGDSFSIKWTATKGEESEIR